MLNLFIPPLYWGLVFPLRPKFDYYNFAAHGVSAAFLLIDVFFENFPITWVDLIIVLSYGYGYMFWVYVFNSLTGRWIYPFYDPKIVPIQWIVVINISVGVSFFIAYFIVKFLIWIRLIIVGLLKRKLNKFLWTPETIEEYSNENNNLIEN
eukprot:gene4979-8573_t